MLTHGLSVWPVRSVAIMAAFALPLNATLKDNPAAPIIT